jgi:hypothetical protein
MRAICYVCGKKAWHDRAGYGFLVSECDRCEREVCEVCAESDYGCVGDPLQFVCTQWICSGGCKSTDLVLYDPRFRFDWTYVADCEEQALINTCRQLNAQMQETTRMMREAIAEINAVSRELAA